MTPRVVVVGGGLAGVATALDAAQWGADVTLLERRHRLGGLTWSFSRNGRTFDNGHHVFLRCCTAYRSFLEELGVSDRVVLQRPLDIPVLAPGGRTCRIRSAPLPAPFHLAPALVRYRHVGVADRARLGLALVALERLDLADPALDRVTFAAFLARHGQRRETIARLWDIITVATCNLPADQVSLALAAKVFRTGLLDAADAADVGWSAVPLGDLHDRPARAALDRHGVEVRLGIPAEAVAPGAPGVTGSPAWTVATPEGVIGADAVVLAVPPPAAAGIAPPGSLPDLAGLGWSPIVNIHLVFDRPVTELGIFAAVDSPVQFAFDRTEASGLAASGLPGGQVLTLSLSAADELVGQPSTDLVAAHLDALRALLPAVAGAELVDAVVVRERQATFRGVPGSADYRLRPDAGPPGLLVAGAWCATGWPATMEGAVRSGIAASSAIRDGSGPSTAGLSAVPPAHSTARPGNGDGHARSSLSGQADDPGQADEPGQPFDPGQPASFPPTTTTRTVPV